MTIDLLNLQPQQISKDLRGKYILLYGPPKVGKTTLAAEFQNSLICGFEPGTNALQGAMVQPVGSWDDWKKAVRQLIKNKGTLTEKFHTIVIDTADEAYKACERYVCEQANTDTIKDVAKYGGGYKILDTEFETTFRDLAYAGYGLLFISHSVQKEQRKDNSDETYEQYIPTLPNRPFNIINKMVDIITFLKEIEYKDGDEIKKKRVLFFRGTDKFYAGSRFKHIVPYTDLSYSNLVNSIYDAIDKEVEEKGGAATMETNPYNQKTFDDLIDDAKKLWGQAINKEKTKEAAAILEEEFGKPTKFSEITTEQKPQLEIVLFKIRELLEL